MYVQRARGSSVSLATRLQDLWGAALREGGSGHYWPCSIAAHHLGAMDGYPSEIGLKQIDPNQVQLNQVGPARVDVGQEYNGLRLG